jgi:hypothetical protein
MRQRPHFVSSAPPHCRPRAAAPNESDHQRHAEAPPEERVAEARRDRARDYQDERVVDDLHCRDRESVRRERESGGAAKWHVRAQHGAKRQRVAEDERERDRQRDRGGVTQPSCSLPSDCRVRQRPPPHAMAVVRFCLRRPPKSGEQTGERKQNSLHIAFFARSRKPLSVSADRGFKSLPLRSTKRVPNSEPASEEDVRFRKLFQSVRRSPQTSPEVHWFAASLANKWRTSVRPFVVY